MPTDPAPPERMIDVADLNEREDGAGAIVQRYAKFINERPALLSLLYDIDMLPEQTTTRAGAIRLAGLCEFWKKGESGELAPSTAPVADVRKLCIRAMDHAGTLPAKQSVKLRPADWHALTDAILSAAPASPSTREEIARVIDETAECHSENRMDRAFLDNSEEIADRILALFAQPQEKKQGSVEPPPSP
jgi:hypothetical protein